MKLQEFEVGLFKLSLPKDRRVQKALVEGRFKNVFHSAEVLSDSVIGTIKENRQMLAIALNKILLEKRYLEQININQHKGLCDLCDIKLRYMKSYKYQELEVCTKCWLPNKIKVL